MIFNHSFNSGRSIMAAEGTMDTCPSPEISDSRKRPLDGDAENATTKRSHYGGSEYILFEVI